MNIPVFDLHCDTSLAMLGDDLSERIPLRKNGLHIDLERAGNLAGYAQCFGCFTTTWEELPNHLSVDDVFEREYQTVLQEIKHNSDVIAQARTASDVQQNLENGIMSAILTIEGPAGFGFDPSRLEQLYQLGFRITTLGWNEKNPLTGSHQTGGGLTDLGREYVKEAQRLGMIIDVSHISDEGFWDIMDITQAPVIASHSNSRSMCNVSRNLTDSMFLEICKTGGVAGFNQFSEFVGDHADLRSAAQHFLHFMELDPTGHHIALGGDLDGCDSLPVGFSGVQDYPALADVLADCGLSRQNIEDIYWNNALGVLAQCCM